MRYKVSSPPQLWGQDSAYSVPAKKKKDKSLLPVDLNTYKGNIDWRFLVQACRSTCMETLEMKHYSFLGMLFLFTFTLCMIWFWWVLACATFFFKWNTTATLVKLHSSVMHDGVIRQCQLGSRDDTLVKTLSFCQCDLGWNSGITSRLSLLFSSCFA